MIGTEKEIEAVARAFYDLQDCARGWDREPDRLKERFLKDAAAVIAVLDDYMGTQASQCREAYSPEVVAGDSIPVTAPGYGGEKPRRVAYPVNEQAFQVCSGASSNAARLSALSRDRIRYSKTLIAQSVALLQSHSVP